MYDEYIDRVFSPRFIQQTLDRASVTELNVSCMINTLIECIPLRFIQQKLERASVTELNVTSIINTLTECPPQVHPAEARA